MYNRINESRVLPIEKTVRVQDAGFVMLSHLSDTVSCKIADPEIAEIAVSDAEEAIEEEDGSITKIYAENKTTACKIMPVIIADKEKLEALKLMMSVHTQEFNWSSHYDKYQEKFDLNQG